MFSRITQTKQQKSRRIVPVLAALALVSLLSGCVIYDAPPHHHYYWH